VNQATIRQHYIWRNHLAPWTDNGSATGTIICFQDQKIFPVSLTNIALEKYFYSIKELSTLEKSIICEMTIKNVTGRQKEVNQGWLDLYCAPFDLVDEAIQWRKSVGYPLDKAYIQSSQSFGTWITDYIERLHAHIESTGKKYIDLLRQNDLSFWGVEKCRDEFSFFLCNQYFRTKRMRDSVAGAFAINKAEHEALKQLQPENMWLPLSLIFATNVGAHISHEYTPVMLQAEENCFLVGDQPIVNTRSTFNPTSPPSDLELFYPITPHSALLLTTDSKYCLGQTIVIDANEVEKYNELEFKTSGCQVFAKDRAQLAGLSQIKS